MAYNSENIYFRKGMKLKFGEYEINDVIDNLLLSFYDSLSHISAEGLTTMR